MKKFKYSMENLLQIKQKLEDQTKIAYGNARLQHRNEEEKLEQMVSKQNIWEDELRGLRCAKLDLIKIRQYEYALDHLKQKINQQMTIVRNAAHRLEVARIRLNQAVIDRKTQERLKEKAFDEYMLELDAEERKEVDERNSFHYKSPMLSGEDR